MTLKSVDEHNNEKRAIREEFQRKALLTGVACPQCGHELNWVSVRYVYSVWPPPTTRQATCLQCSLSIALEA